MWLSFPDHTLGEEPSDLCPVLNLLQTLSLPLRLFTSEVICFISGIYEKAPPLPLILFSHFCFLYPRNFECLSWGFSSLKLLLFLRGNKDMWKFLPDSGSSGLPMVYSTPEALPSLYHSFLGWSLPPESSQLNFLVQLWHHLMILSRVTVSTLLSALSSSLMGHRMAGNTGCGQRVNGASNTILRTLNFYKVYLQEPLRWFHLYFEKTVALDINERLYRREVTEGE